MAVFIGYIDLYAGLQNAGLLPMLVIVRESNGKYVFFKIFSIF